MSSHIDLTKPIKTPETVHEIGDVYFTGLGWKVVVAKAGCAMAMQDCTDAVRSAGQIITPYGVACDVVVYELNNYKPYNPNRLF